VAIDGQTVSVRPGRPLSGRLVRVPGDISSAAFFLVAGALAGAGSLLIREVGVNPTRTGALEILAAMGARVESRPVPDDGEPMADLKVEPTGLRGTVVAGDLVPRSIDEIPILAVAAAAAEGPTEIRDAAELRVKESDRIHALTTELGKMGVSITERPDGLRLTGRPASGPAFRGARVSSWGDHRLAMALIVAALSAEGSTVVEDVDCIATSYPDFVATLRGLVGADAVEVRP
jgi:3-phosphoshikimate 1-carboxyvinyltransferase